MKNLLLFVFIFLSQFTFAQQYMKLTANLKNYPKHEFMLLSGDEGGVFIVERTETNANGKLEILWEGEPGFYRLADDKGHIDFRISKSSIEFSLSGSMADGELSFPDKDENNQYHYYLSEFNLMNESMRDLRSELKGMSEKDSLYKEMSTELKRLKREKRSMLKDLWVNQIDNSWSARFAVAQQELLPDLKLKSRKADEYYLKHFFDYFTFSDSLLVGTPVYYEKVGKYLKAQNIDDLIANENYKKVKEIVGNLFWFTELKPEYQKYLTNYLMNRYPEKEYKMVYHIIADAYKVLNTCEYVLNTKTIQHRINNVKNLEKGWVVPDAELFHSKDGRVQNLSAVNSELTLLVIWSGSCEHSIDLLNRVKSIYSIYKPLGLEVVAISLDHNLNFWNEILRTYDYPWINSCDTDGLKGKTASQFNIYVTPAMFLIDQSLKAHAMPLTFFQLEKELMERFK